ncbi:hypothetical protein, partial [Acinetobacter soli]|uniref:hypothetical protein n=1 Tax=Acinetobacter soli TaxID=487316 RepID=UPI0013C30D68
MNNSRNLTKSHVRKIHTDYQIKRESKLLTLRKKWIKIAFFLFLGNGASIFLQLIMVPLLIFSWGGELYGEWIILYTIPGILSLTDLGIISSSNNKIDELCVTGKYLSANKIYFSSLVALFLISVFVILFSVILWMVFERNITSMFHILEVNEIRSILFYLILDSLLIILFNHNTGLYRSIDSFQNTTNWQTIGRIIPLLIFCFSAVLFKEIIISVLVMLISRLLIVFMMIVDLRKKIYWIKKDWLRTNRKEVKKIFSSSLGFLSLPISNIITLQLTIILIAMLSNPLMVATFSALRTFTRLIPQFVSIVGKSLWSEISKANALSDFVNLKIMFKKTLLYTLTLSFLLLFGYLIFGEWFFKLWTNSKLNFNQEIFFALLIQAVFIGLYTSLEVFILATNNVNLYAQVFFVISLLQIIMAWLFLDSFDIAGFPIFGSIGAFLIVL